MINLPPNIRVASSMRSFGARGLAGRLCIVLAVLLASTSFAQAKKKKVIRLDALTVEGRIQKPQAFYILQRSTLNFDELNRAESFIPKVEKSVEKDAF